MAFSNDFFREMKASWLLGRGSKQIRKGRLQEARDTLQRALAVIGPVPKGAFVHGWSVRFTILTALSRAAADLNDLPLARASIQEALDLWASGPLSGKPHHNTEWESWARSYLVWSDAQKES
jgi:hypothetical protein